MSIIVERTKPLRYHVVLAGAVITAAWVAGTWRCFRLVRLAHQGGYPRSPITMTADERTGRS